MSMKRAASRKSLGTLLVGLSRTDFINPRILVSSSFLLSRLVSGQVNGCYGGALNEVGRKRPPVPGPMNFCHRDRLIFVCLKRSSLDMGCWQNCCYSHKDHENRLEGAYSIPIVILRRFVFIIFGFKIFVVPGCLWRWWSGAYINHGRRFSCVWASGITKPVTYSRPSARAMHFLLPWLLRPFIYL